MSTIWVASCSLLTPNMTISFVTVSRCFLDREAGRGGGSIAAFIRCEQGRAMTLVVVHCDRIYLELRYALIEVRFNSTLYSQVSVENRFLDTIT